MSLGGIARTVWEGTAARIGRLLGALQRPVNVLGLFALVIVIVNTVFTTTSDQRIRYGKLLSDLSLAYVAAWIFNQLVVELPRRNEKKRLYTSIAWMIGLMAESGHFMMQKLALAANEDINVDPNIGGIIIPANREFTDRICASIGPETPYVPLAGAKGCWAFIRDQIQLARDYHRDLVPWLSAFDVDVVAAMNAVILSQLSMLCDDLPQIGNKTLAELSGQIFEHWKACDELMDVHYAKVQPYVPEFTRSLRWSERWNYTPSRHHDRALASARMAIAEAKRSDTSGASP